MLKFAPVGLIAFAMTTALAHAATQFSDVARKHLASCVNTEFAVKKGQAQNPIEVPAVLYSNCMYNRFLFAELLIPSGGQRKEIYVVVNGNARSTFVTTMSDPHKFQLGSSTPTGLYLGKTQRGKERILIRIPEPTVTLEKAQEPKNILAVYVKTDGQQVELKTNF